VSRFVTTGLFFVHKVVVSWIALLNIVHYCTICFNMTEFRTVSDITERWPGIAEHDIEQAADFIEYHVTEGGEAIDAILEDLESPERDLLYSLADSVSWRLRQQSELTREEVLQAASEAIFNHEQHRVSEDLRSGDKELAERSVRELLGKWPVELAICYSPSPLFPDGRQQYVPLDLSDGRKPKVPQRTEYVADCHGEKVKLREDIVKYVNRSRDSGPTDEEIEEMQSLAESVLNFDEQEYELLKEAFGTKAATLFILAETIETFSSASESMQNTANFVVPKLTVAPTELHRMYKAGDERYEDYLEDIRQKAIAVTQGDQFDPELYRPLVAVRSSAVKSEDGDNVSGAGIYASVSADPRDPDSFRQAVETVFDSMDTEEAQAYLEENGIDEEHMGLLIQRYVEDTKNYKDTCIYGYVQSSDPFGRFITLSSETGELLFDRSAAEARFMVDPPFGQQQPTLHYTPDHDTLISDFSRGGARLANAALFAEKLFGKQVELEFVLDYSNTAHVVQVRPLPNQEKPEEVIFPSDVDPIVECRAIGVGDVIVTVRDDEEYGPDEHKLHWIDTEYHMGGTFQKRDHKSVFVIGYNDANSGHIQMLARERGQICLYPNALTALPPSISDEISPDWNQRRVRKFRVVADGYRGAIYPVDEERTELLQRLATNFSKYIIDQSSEL